MGKNRFVFPTQKRQQVGSRGVVAPYTGRLDLEEQRGQSMSVHRSGRRFEGVRRGSDRHRIAVVAGIVQGLHTHWRIIYESLHQFIGQVVEARFLHFPSQPREIEWRSGSRDLVAC